MNKGIRIGDFLAEPTNLKAYEVNKCPNNGFTCILISDKCNFACRTCGTGFFVSINAKLEPFDWHGKYPWA